MLKYHWQKFYILIFLASLIGNGYFVFRWQNAELNFSKAYQLAETYKGLDEKHKGERDEYKETLSVTEEQLQAKAAELKTKQAEVDQAIAQLNEAKKQVDNLNSQIANQESQLSANSAELEKLRNRPPLFNFKNSSARDVESAKTEVREIVTSTYNYIESIYGKPYLLHSVSINFVNNLTIPGAIGEISITNSDQGLDLEIRITDFNKNNFSSVNTIIHEIVHSFHGLAVLETSAYEEGIAVAATDAVMEKMIGDGKLPNFSPLYIQISEDQYNGYNNDPSFIIPESTSAFYGSSKTPTYYQVTGYGWMKLYRQDPDFFRRFNETYYKYIQEGQSPHKAMVLEVIKGLMPVVGNEPIDQYLTRSKAFNL